MPSRCSFDFSIWVARLNASWYQDFKGVILAIIPLAKDAVHLYIGVGALLLTCLFTRSALSSTRSLIPGALLSIAMELLDLVGDLDSPVGPMWGAYLHDLINTNLLPVLIVIVANVRSRWAGR